MVRSKMERRVWNWLWTLSFSLLVDMFVIEFSVAVASCVDVHASGVERGELLGLCVKGEPRIGVEGKPSEGIPMSSGGKGGKSDCDICKELETWLDSMPIPLAFSKCSKRRNRIASNFLTISAMYETFVSISTVPSRWP